MDRNVRLTFVQWSITQNEINNVNIWSAVARERDTFYIQRIKWKCINATFSETLIWAFI